MINSATREAMNKHFTSIAQNYANNKKVYTLYYSLTTWSRDVIFGEKQRIFTKEDPSMYEALASTVPAPFVATQGQSNILNASLADQMSRVSIADPVSDQTSVLFTKILSLMPSNVPRYKKNNKELEAFMTFQHETEVGVKSLESDSNLNWDDDSIKVVTQDIRDLFDQYCQFVGALKVVKY